MAQIVKENDSDNGMNSTLFVLITSLWNRWKWRKITPDKNPHLDEPNYARVAANNLVLPRL